MFSEKFFEPTEKSRRRTTSRRPRRRPACRSGTKPPAVLRPRQPEVSTPTASSAAVESSRPAARRPGHLRVPSVALTSSSTRPSPLDQQREQRHQDRAGDHHR